MVEIRLVHRYGIWCHVCNSVTDPILRHILCYTNDQQLHHQCHLMILSIQVHFLIYWHEYVDKFYEVFLCYTMVYKLTKNAHKGHLALECSRMSSSSTLECKYMTLTISMLINIFPLPTKHNTIIPSIPMCYANCHTLTFVHFKKNTYLDK